MDLHRKVTTGAAGAPNPRVVIGIDGGLYMRDLTRDGGEPLPAKSA
jgi:hypothetical protein